MLNQLGIVEKSAVLDVRRLPSIDVRKKAHTKTDITGKAFATVHGTSLQSNSHWSTEDASASIACIPDKM